MTVRIWFAEEVTTPPAIEAFPATAPPLAKFTPAAFAMTRSWKWFPARLWAANATVCGVAPAKMVVWVPVAWNSVDPLGSLKLPRKIRVPAVRSPVAVEPFQLVVPTMATVSVPFCIFTWPEPVSVNELSTRTAKPLGANTPDDWL